MNGILTGVLSMGEPFVPGTVKAPGVYMTNNGGAKGFMGGLIGHLVFGLIVALTYGLFIH